MLPDYIYAVGGTAKIKQFIDWLMEHRTVARQIQEKTNLKESYKI